MYATSLANMLRMNNCPLYPLKIFEKVDSSEIQIDLFVDFCQNPKNVILRNFVPSPGMKNIQPRTRQIKFIILLQVHMNN
jgi:hypothetical protein